MCIRKLFSKKGKTIFNETSKTTMPLNDSIDVEVNCDKSFRFSYLNKNRMVLYISIKNKDDSSKTLLLSILPNGKLINEISIPLKKRIGNGGFFSNAVSKNTVRASFDNNQLTIEGNCTVNDVTIIVSDYFVYSKLQLVITSNNEIKTIDIFPEIIRIQDFS